MIVHKKNKQSTKGLNEPGVINNIYILHCSIFMVNSIPGIQI